MLSFIYLHVQSIYSIFLSSYLFTVYIFNLSILLLCLVIFLQFTCSIYLLYCSASSYLFIYLHVQSIYPIALFSYLFIVYMFHLFLCLSIYLSSYPYIYIIIYLNISKSCLLMCLYVTFINLSIFLFFLILFFCYIVQINNLLSLFTNYVSLHIFNLSI